MKRIKVRVKNQDTNKNQTAANSDIREKSNKYIIRDRECGNVIETFDSYTDAVNTLNQYEIQDKLDDSYTEDFYEIVKEDNVDPDTMSDNICEAVCNAVYDVLESFGINECALPDADNDMLTDAKIPLINVIEKLIIKANSKETD